MRIMRAECTTRQVSADNGDGIDLGAHWIGRTQHHLLQVAQTQAFRRPHSLTACGRC
jgi:hypothetical protein